MANHAERKETYNPTPTGNLVPLTLDVGPKPIKYFDDIQYPPDPRHGDPQGPATGAKPVGKHHSTVMQAADDIGFPPNPPQGDPRPPHGPAIGGQHDATYVWMSIGKLHQKSLASLALEIETRRAHELHLRIWISKGEGKENLWKGKFVSREFKLHVDGKSIIHLDHAAQQEAQPFFVKGNTLALIVYPPQQEDHFKVRLGTLAGSAAKSKKAGR